MPFYISAVLYSSNAWRKLRLFDAEASTNRVFIDVYNTYTALHIQYTNDTLTRNALQMFLLSFTCQPSDYKQTDHPPPRAILGLLLHNCPFPNFRSEILSQLSVLSSKPFNSREASPALVQFAHTSAWASFTVGGWPVLPLAVLSTHRQRRMNLLIKAEWAQSHR